MIALLALQVAAAGASPAGGVRPTPPEVSRARDAVEAERAFAAMASAKGQWTAFRAFADDDATMFVPLATNAQSWLKDRRDPSRSIEWWPSASWVSCDGSYAINTGGWRGADGGNGYFSTVWRRQPSEVGGYRWIVDGGDALKAPRPRPAQPVVRRAACRSDGEPPLPLEHTPAGVTESSAASLDGTLRWHWAVDAKGARLFEAAIWDGKRFERVLIDRIAAPAQ